MSKYVNIATHLDFDDSIYFTFGNSELIPLRDALNERIAELRLEDSPINKMSVSDEFKEFLMGFCPSCAPSRESVESVTVVGVEKQAGGDELVTRAVFSNGDYIFRQGNSWLWSVRGCYSTDCRHEWPQYAIDEIERIEREEAERDAGSVVIEHTGDDAPIAKADIAIKAIKEIRHVINFMNDARNVGSSVLFKWGVDLDGGDAS